MTEPRRYGLRSLRFKLVLASILIETVMLSALVWNSTRITGDGIQEIFQNRIESLVSLMNVSLANPLAQRDYATLDERLVRIVQKESLVYLEVRDELGKIVASRGDFPEMPHLDTSVETSAGVFDQEFDITLANRPIGRARYGLNVSLLEATTNSLRNQGALLASVEIILTILLLSSLGYLMTRHLQILAQAARETEAGDLTTRVPIAGHDEVADVAHAFNTMMSALERDVADMRRTEERLRQWETVFQHAGWGVVLINPSDDRLLAVNPAFAAMHGYRVDEMIGMNVADTLAPQDRHLLPEYVRIADQTGRSTFEAVRLRKDGSQFLCLADVSFVRDPSGNALYRIANVQDITARKRNEALVNGQKLILEMIARNEELPETLLALVRQIEALHPEMLCSILLLDAEGAHLHHAASPSLPLDYIRAIDGIAIGPNVGSCGTAAFRRENVFVEDIATDPLWADYKALALRHGLRACWSTPIFDAQRKMLGTFAIYYRHPNRPEALHLRLIDITTHIAAIAIARKRDETTLYDSEQRLRLAVSGGAVGIWEWQVATGHVIWNDQLKTIFGLSTETTGLTLDKFVAAIHPDDRASAERTFRTALEQHTAFKDEYRICWPDGTLRWIAASGCGDYDASGQPARMLGAAIDITGRKLAEDQLQEREQRLSTLISNLPGVAFRVRNDPNYTTEYVSDQIAALTGYPADDFRENRRNFGELMHPDDRDRVWNETQKALNEHRPYEVSYRFIDAQGREKWNWEKGKGIYAANGEPQAIEGFAQDISERREAEAALRESEGRLRTVTDTTQVGLVIVDPKHCYRYANPAYAKILRLPSHELVGLRVADVLPSVYPTQIRPRLERAFRGERVNYELSVPSSTPDQEARYYDVTYEPRVEGAEPRVVVVIFDITERKHAEAAIRQYETVFQLAGWGMTIVDPATNVITHTNPAFARMHGYPVDDMIGMNLADTFSPESRATFAGHVNAAHDKGHYVYESVHLRKDGSHFPCLTDVTVYKDAAGRILFRASTFEDITERKRAEAVLRDYNIQLQKISRRLLETQEIERRNINRELHDRIGQNLSVLNLNLNLIRSKLPKDLPRAVKARLDEAQTQLEATTAHVRDVMAELHPPALDEYGLLAALRAYAASFGARANTPVAVNGGDLSSRLPIAVEMALFRIAQEALVNVAKHARAKRAEVTLAETAEKVTLTIADHGVGFDVAPGSPRDTSWGLSVMRERAEAAGATLRIESAPDKGTRVIVEVARSS